MEKTLTLQTWQTPCCKCSSTACSRAQQLAQSPVASQPQHTPICLPQTCNSCYRALTQTARTPSMHSSSRLWQACRQKLSMLCPNGLLLLAFHRKTCMVIPLLRHHNMAPSELLAAEAVATAVIAVARHTRDAWQQQGGMKLDQYMVKVDNAVKLKTREV